MWDVVANYKGKFTVVRIPKDTPIPNELVLLYEHGDHYSLQTAVPCKASELNARLSAFLEPCEKLTVAEFSRRYPVENALNHNQ